METNNKLREALKLCLRGMCGYCRMDAEARGMTTECVNGCKVMLDAKAALAEPVKNCEVGTAEEQSERFDKFCHANINTQRCCGDCPAFRTTRDDCELVWAQLPYEAKEGGAK